MPPKDDRDLPSLLLWLLLLLLLITLTVLRFVFTAPARVAARHRTFGDQVLVWYYACTQALWSMDLPQLPGEAPASYLLRCQEALSGQIPLIQLGKAVCVARYSSHRLKGSAVRKAEETYRALCTQLSLMQRLRMHAHRFLHGIPFKDKP